MWRCAKNGCSNYVENCLSKVINMSFFIHADETMFVPFPRGKVFDGCCDLNRAQVIYAYSS